MWASSNSDNRAASLHGLHRSGRLFVPCSWEWVVDVTAFLNLTDFKCSDAYEFPLINTSQFASCFGYFIIFNGYYSKFCLFSSIL
jgi:hypothetical protein